MRLHRFFISEEVGNKGEFSISSPDLVNQLRRVFRLKTGDRVIVFDGSGSDHICRIEAFGKEDVTLAVSEVKKSPFMPSRPIYLCAAVVKKDIFEWIAEKATELGVTNIIPIEAERSEKKGLNEKRLTKIVTEASEQSGRGNVPDLQPITGLQDAIDDLKGKDIIPIAFHTDTVPFDRNIIVKDAPIALFIGPEGGWSEDEIGLFHKNNIPVVCLGSQVLRAETAVIATLSLVSFAAR